MTSDGKKTSSFACPITCCDNVVDMINEPRNDRKYMPCPERFAYHFGCPEEGIHTALKSFDAQEGAGKSGISSTNLASNRQRWVREHPMERRNGPTTVALPSG